jgi:hypothetical protein
VLWQACIEQRLQHTGQERRVDADIQFIVVFCVATQVSPELAIGIAEQPLEDEIQHRIHDDEPGDSCKHCELTRDVARSEKEQNVGHTEGDLAVVNERSCSKSHREQGQQVRYDTDRHTARRRNGVVRALIQALDLGERLLLRMYLFLLIQHAIVTGLVNRLNEALQIVLQSGEEVGPAVIRP